LVDGDYAGPAGARAVLRDPRVEAAVLETARGGMLRRGLAVRQATAAIITNISEDHFGEYGIANLRDLAEVKGIVRRPIGTGGRLVLNADDPTLRAFGEQLVLEGSSVPLAWFSTQPDDTVIKWHVARGGDAAVVRDGRVMLHTTGAWRDLGDVTAIPITLGGTAPHNISNAVGAALVAAASGVPVDAIRTTLANFGAAPTDNPGRLQIFRFGGATVLVDYAHNPDGIAALCRTAATMPATRRLLVLGQAGNRDDDLLRALARTAYGLIRFDHVVLKEMTRMLRGRTAGDITRVLGDELRRAGMSPDQIENAASEPEAVRRAFAWARSGDLILCPVHAERDVVMAWIDRVRAVNWVPGMPLPD
jgi:UDP-N-acetylmuramyl tripeptide synthase